MRSEGRIPRRGRASCRLVVEKRGEKEIKVYKNAFGSSGTFRLNFFDRGDSNARVFSVLWLYVITLCIDLRYGCNVAYRRYNAMK